MASAYARYEAWPGGVAGRNGTNHGMPFEGTVFVFPNRRSMKFFQKYLGEEFGKIYSMPLFTPDMLTISELFNEISRLDTVDPIEAQYILYRNYISLKYPEIPFEKGSELESFDEFLHWSNLIIADFNDIDKYLIDARQLFTNIKDLRQLDSDYSFLSERQYKAVEKFWSSFLRGEGNFKKEHFSSLWGIMYDLYTKFRSDLKEKGAGYEGMIYRCGVENLGQCHYEKLVFVGFNAPNKCEKALMRHFKELGRGDFYWDYYGPFVTDRDNKASLFISEAVKEFPSKYTVESVHEMPAIHAVGVSSGVGQTFVAADILKNIVGEDPIKSAVVLPDENLLIPLLNSIPKEFDKVNVTMGFPIKATPLTSFMESLAALQHDVKRKEGKQCFYHGSISAILSHEYIRESMKGEAERIMESIVKENLIYIDSESPLVRDAEAPLLQAIFKVASTASDLLDYLIEVLKELDFIADTLNKEFIYRYYLALDRLKKLAIPMRKETCLRILSQITSSVTIPFKGEPLAGLQVIGSLEVRALDFDNLIILSVNEGKFPASSQMNSLIPYNLRVGFGLPTYELHDAIAAYHFYRSIYRAKNVWLVYDTRTDGIKSGEVSRFVKQLKFHYNIAVDERTVAISPVIDNTETEISVPKSEEVMKKLHAAFDANGGEKILSASSINSYLTCPLQFYLQYVEGIREESEIEESIEASTFGTIFHDSMQELYAEYQGEVVSAGILDSIIKDRKRIDAVIEDKFKKNRIAEIVGKNIIVKEVIKKYILITLQEDKKYAPFTYIAGEETFYHNFILPDGLEVKFKAVVDRMDYVNGVLRVIDYKTGGVEVPKMGTAISDFFMRDTGKQYKAFVQLYLYALIIDAKAENGVLKLKNGKKANVAFDNEFSEFDMCVYPITSIKKNSIISEPVYKGNLEEYREALFGCVAEIFNKEIPFMQACRGSAACSYCMFKQICNR